MKKVLNIAGKIVTALVMLFTFSVMIFTVISVSTVGKDADFFGYKPNIVLSDSMNDIFSVGDLEISKKVDPETLEVGDIITFKPLIQPVMARLSHTKSVKSSPMRENRRSQPTARLPVWTMSTRCPFSNVIGKYQFRLPKMGYFFEFLRTPAGYFSIILIPFLFLIALQAVKFFRLARQYRAEQQAELAAQRAEVEARRRETTADERRTESVAFTDDGRRTDRKRSREKYIRR